MTALQPATPQAQANLNVREAWQKPNDLRAGGVMPIPPGVNPAMPQGGAPPPEDQQMMALDAVQNPMSEMDMAALAAEQEQGA